MGPRDVDEAAPAEVLDLLVQVSFTVLGVLTRAAAAHDLSLTQLRVLAILRDRSPTMAELAGHLGLERSSVSGLVDRAASRGLVRRSSSSEDGRTVLVHLTAQGRRLAGQLTEEVAALVAPLTSRLDASARRQFATLLGEVLAPSRASP